MSTCKVVLVHIVSLLVIYPKEMITRAVMSIQVLTANFVKAANPGCKQKKVKKGEAGFCLC
jgi:hypothetical protein